jgi:group I intron endonuclease
VTLNTGVYSITNKINGKRYIGSAVNIASRWVIHRRALRKGDHHSKHLQKSWDKYGAGVFVFGVVCEVWNVDKLIKIEQTFLDLYQSYDIKFGYNICKVAGSTLGYHFSDESKRKMSLARQGRIITDETKRKMADAHRGPKNWNFGLHLTEEVKQKLRKAQTGKYDGAKNPNYGRKHTDEAKRRISVAASGRKGLRGELGPRAVLTWEKVREIRARYAAGGCTHQELAHEYGVCNTTITLLINQKNWKEEL